MATANLDKINNKLLVNLVTFIRNSLLRCTKKLDHYKSLVLRGSITENPFNKESEQDLYLSFEKELTALKLYVSYEQIGEDVFIDVETIEGSQVLEINYTFENGETQGDVKVLLQN